VRVVGGEARGRRFDAPAGRTTRPTSDRVREAIFGVLGSLPGDAELRVAEATVADLYAGSGGLGIEALSRGASRAVFVDDDHRAVATIADNLARLGLAGPRATVVRNDALRWLRTAGPVDLVLCDPPYAFDDWPALASLLAPVAGVAVLESAVVPELGPGWEVLREKHYGGTVVTVARPARSSVAPEPAPERKGDA
jgi:16S rRNA (guanine966-N2)-methyltransferase